MFVHQSIEKSCFDCITESPECFLSGKLTYFTLCSIPKSKKCGIIQIRTSVLILRKEGIAMDAMEKLRILTDAAKYDAACTSSGLNRAGKRGTLGNAAACGICHSFSADGRCISLLKVLMSNACVYNCAYCVNRRENDSRRTSFTPRELADLTIAFYRRNYIEGLFLSSAIVKIRITPANAYWKRFLSCATSTNSADIST